MAQKQQKPGTTQGKTGNKQKDTGRKDRKDELSLEELSKVSGGRARKRKIDTSL